MSSYAGRSQKARNTAVRMLIQAHQEEFEDLLRRERVREGLPPRRPPTRLSMALQEKPGGEGEARGTRAQAPSTREHVRLDQETRRGASDGAPLPVMAPPPGIDFRRPGCDALALLVINDSDSPAPARQANPIWDVLAEHWPAPRTKSERAMWGKVVKELRDAEATADEVHRACRYVRSRFDNPSVMAIPKWFSQAQDDAALPSRMDAQQYLRIGGFRL